MSRIVITKTVRAIQPMRDMLLVERTPAKKQEGLIHLPSIQDDDKTTSGTVIRIGPDVNDVNVLDTIMFSKFAGTEIDGGYLLMEEREVHCVVVL